MIDLDSSARSKSNPTETASQRPADDAIHQQRMRAWTPILHPVWVICALFAIAAAFIPVGYHLRGISDDIEEMIEMYDTYGGEDGSASSDGYVSKCGIDKANEGNICEIQFEVKEDMKGPVLVYYEIDKFHQNHRNYETSRDDSQLLGSLQETEFTRLKCNPLLKLGNMTLNPCGLIANTFFNDIINFVPNASSENQKDLQMLEKGIAWQTDLRYKFKRPMGFNSMQCDDCDDCECTSPEWSCTERWKDPNDGKCYKYYYPNDSTTQYLHETYPDIISPLEGVRNEHFVVWMRIATQAKFRKLYGYFEEGIKKGETLTFEVVNNWDVKRFKGSKSLVVTTTSAFGGKNPSLGNSFIVVGVFCAIAGTFFSLKHLIKPRKLADDKYLKYKVE